MYKMQKMIASSPEIENNMPSQLGPYVKQAQCRQDTRIETEDKKRLMAVIATDGALFLASLVGMATTYGAATPAATATGTRLGLTLGRALKMTAHQSVIKTSGAGGLIAVPILIDEAVDACINKKDTLDYKKAGSSQNICQNLKANVTHTTDFTSCVQISIAAVFGLRVRPKIKTRHHRIQNKKVNEKTK